MEGRLTHKSKHNNKILLHIRDQHIFDKAQKLITIGVHIFINKGKTSFFKIIRINCSIIILKGCSVEGQKVG